MSQTEEDKFTVTAGIRKKTQAVCEDDLPYVYCPVNEARADDDWWGRDRKRAGERLSCQCQSRRSDPHGQVRTSVPEESAASVTGAPLLGNHQTHLFSRYFYYYK